MTEAEIEEYLLRRKGNWAAYVRRLTSNQNDYEDLLQEGLWFVAKAMRGQERLEHDSYYTTILRNRVTSIAGKTKPWLSEPSVQTGRQAKPLQQPRSTPAERRHVESSIKYLDEPIPSGVDNPDAPVGVEPGYQRIEVDNLVERTLADRPPAHRALVRLVLAGESQSHAARIVGLAHATAHKSWTKAAADLRSAYMEAAA